MSLNQDKLLNLDPTRLEDLQEINLCKSDAQNSDSYEVTPRVEHYLRKCDNNFMERPSLDQLYNPSILHVKDQPEFNKNMKTNDGIKINEKDKFGLFSMVYVPTFMNLLGTTLYLRMGLIVGEAGILLALLQVLIGTIILVLTVLSMSAICTNGDVGNGGFYFLISRSLGPEIGAMFGCLYFLTNAIMVAFSIIGVCIEVQYILQSFNIGIVEIPSGFNDKRIVGLITLVIISLIPFISLDFEAKSQWFLFGIVILSLLDFFVGLMIPPTEYQRAYGIVGWDKDVLKTNLLPQFDTTTFFPLFSLYTSSIAGDFTGMTMASTLKNPKVDIPKGSILSIISTTVIYALQIIFFGSTVVRYSSGNVSDVKFNNQTCDSRQQCNYGLIPDQYIMSRSSLLTIIGYRMHYIEPVFVAGLLAQSLSSGLSSFISAPRILQAIGFDKLLPLTRWFSKGSGRHADPRRGYILTFIISLIFIGLANFDVIANVVSNCYLFAWSLLNIAVFHSDYVGSPNWRPSFKYYNKWLSLLCAIICFVLMFCFDWISSLCLLAIVSTIWIIIYYYKPEANWGPTTESQLYKTTVSFAHKLNLKSDHVKNFRPSVLLLCGTPKKYSDLISMADNITRNRGMLIIGEVIQTELSRENRNQTIDVWNKWLNQQKVECFYKHIVANSICEGCDMMVQCCGLGSHLSPNIVMVGFKELWKQSTHEEVIDYFNIINKALETDKSLIIYRNNGTNNEKTMESDLTINSIDTLDSNESSKLKSYYNKLKSNKRCSESLEKNFQNKLIDIYWLYDDGGLTLLIPFILSQRKNWRKHKIRIFFVVDNHTKTVEYNLRQLLERLRIDFSELILLEYPAKFTFKNEDNFINQKGVSFRGFEAQTNRYLALREMLETNSKHSSLIVLTIEIPQKDAISPHLFMYWLDMLSTDLQQFLFIRGNQKNVLTFYCD